MPGLRRAGDAKSAQRDHAEGMATETMQIKAAPRGVLYALVMDFDGNLLDKPRKVRTQDEVNQLLAERGMTDANLAVQGRAMAIIRANSACGGPARTAAADA